jgi:hypothetical protein
VSIGVYSWFKGEAVSAKGSFQAKSSYFFTPVHINAIQAGGAHPFDFAQGKL